MRHRWARRAVKFFAVAVVIAGVLGLVVMTLWNWLVPMLFGARSITFVQAIGLLVLSKILFGGFRGAPGMGGPWRHRMRERWARMTPEERDRFQHGWHRHG